MASQPSSILRAALLLLAALLGVACAGSGASRDPERESEAPDSTSRSSMLGAVKRLR